MTVKIIDIPKEYEDEVYEWYDEDIYSNTMLSIIRIMKSLNDNPDAIRSIISEFPSLICAIDNPSMELKQVCQGYCLKFANNLTEDEVVGLLIDRYCDFENFTETNKKKIDNIINGELALSWLEADYIDLSDLDRYKSCDWYNETVRIFKLGNT